VRRIGALVLHGENPGDVIFVEESDFHGVRAFDIRRLPNNGLESVE
jgi:hypothetical protein